ncbi:glycerol-3-phosphate 1-O-acyltransferase PlsY [Desulfosporosinus sp. BG]|uniref:glycerol-3-phosphate 1-O-acyltransferase PlsY n=1 Tax=Desulfosporosinus sp. BG TaxID=1633135 RepID=UPI00083A8979|nr:glycerol-3-phosphate 1-O-acyltransferase PlsY [Desulfosporosinus sp. BG]ODA41089.1 Acyl-phosphate:glycerol-3-phosphate O-acyltransferase PlsY [Desulfosporosinus sp. BG]
MLKYLALLCAYFLGAIPFAYLAGRIRRVDIRSQGSGNIGSTNAFRLLGAKYGLAVFAGDALKGVLATALCLNLWGPWGGVGGGILAIIGHSWNPFFKFKPTGKGVATGFGVITVLVPGISLIAISVFVLVTFVTRYVSLGSTLGAATAVLLTLISPAPVAYKAFVFVAGMLVFVRHRANYQRLLKGTESKLKY